MSEIENWYDPAKQPMHGAWNPDHPLHKEWKFAADLLQQLNETRASLTRQTERVEELERRVAVLEKALDPFAGAPWARVVDRRSPHEEQIRLTDGERAWHLMVADFIEARRARSALDEGRG